MSRWSHVEQAPPDPILGVAEAFKKDPAEKKVNLGIGAYRDEAGKPWVLECVKAAEKVLLEDLNSGKINKEYLPVTGLQDFLNVTSQVCAPVYPSRLLHFCALVARQHWVMGTRCDRFGAAHTQVILGKDSPIIKDKKVAICQSLSGTGALRISAEFLAQYNPGVDIYCSDPTWGNHHAIFAKAGLKTHKYRYLNKVLTSSSLRP